MSKRTLPPLATGPSLPHNAETEKALLGGIFLNPDVLDDVRSALSPDVFFSEIHRIVYLAICHLQDSGKPIDIITVSEQLEKMGMLTKVGGVETLMILTEATPSAAGTLYYIDLIRDCYLRRRIIQIAGQMLQTAQEKTDGQDALNDAESSLLRLRDNGQGKLLSSVEAGKRAVEIIRKNKESPDGMIGLPSGIPPLDAMTQGFGRGELVVIGAGTSQGKSAFALQVALHQARRAMKVLFVSLEMSPERIMLRAFASESKVNLKSIRAGSMTGMQWGQLANATERLDRMEPIRFTDSMDTSIPEIRSMARIMKRQGGLDMVVIDYLQLVSTRGLTLSHSANRTNEVAAITRALKVLAMESDVSVLALSQLSRSDGKPTMKMLRESGSIEQDADVVLLLYREQGEDGVSPTTTLIVGKNRDGETGEIELHFDGATQTYKEQGNGY